jgi:hypothetical protein
MSKVLRFRGKGTTGYRALADALAGRPENFTMGSMRGLYGGGPMLSTGSLPADWCNTYQARHHLITYVIYSYATPIAWHDSEVGWVVPAEVYSVTTSRHQGTVRAALNYNRKDYLD